MASGCRKQASGAYVRKQGQRLWQLNYRRKLNAYNRVAFRDAHRKGTMQFTHSGFEFLPFSDSMGSVSCLSAPPQGHPKGAQQEHVGRLASAPPMAAQPNRNTFPTATASHVNSPRSLILKHRWGHAFY